MRQSSVAQADFELCGAENNLELLNLSSAEIEACHTSQSALPFDFDTFIRLFLPLMSGCGFVFVVVVFWFLQYLFFVLLYISSLLLI